MIEQFKSYFKKLEGLSRDELVHSAGKLVVAENGNIARLIAHLAEMSARKTALELGYKSLYDYCIRALNLSEGAVPARIHVANVSRRFPQLLVALAESRVSLTVAALLAPHLTEDNVDDVISNCAGKTRKETEEYVVAFRPKTVFEPSIRKRPEPTKKVTRLELSSSPPSSSPPTSPVEKTKNSPTILQPAQPSVFNFRFSADRDFRDKFERLAEVLGVDNAQAHMADILEKAIDIALDKKDPKKKLERRRKRQKAGAAPSRSNEMAKKDAPAQSRYIPPRFLSAFTNGAVTNASIPATTGRGVLRGPDCTSTTGRRLPSIAETMSDCFNSYARNTIYCRRSVSTGRILSSGRLIVEDERRHG
ncbi:MAG: hypothetical protein E2P02_27130 [Acidobacteria bacterium]|nr:MAG: hypothetical protein E2P02_27130 [Acidobacteriota bacterium]